MRGQSWYRGTEETLKAERCSRGKKMAFDVTFKFLKIGVIKVARRKVGEKKLLE